MKRLEKLGIYGWDERTENLLLAALLTGDPALLVGRHGCAKTHAVYKLSEAMQKKFVAYDASKTLFDDVLGYPDIEKMKQGRIEYLPSKVTVWDKEIILVDELNRALPEMQAKYLELIRSRKIMGFPTEVKWVFSAMNPISYSGTQQLDEALIGRFATFVYPPDVLEMEESDRIRVACQINGDDCPAVEVWTNGSSRDAVKSIPKEQIEATGKDLKKLLQSAAKHFHRLRQSMTSLSEFLARFADLLMKETKGMIALDGRRLGFIHRNLLANRAIELAKAEQDGSIVSPFSEDARYVMKHSIPVGLNDESVNREDSYHQMEVCFDLLSAYFDKDADLSVAEKVYELFTTADALRKAELLLKEDLGVLAKSKAWNDMIASDESISSLAYIALQVEAEKPNVIPPEIVEALSKKIDPSDIDATVICDLHGDAIDYLPIFEAMQRKESSLGVMIARKHIAELSRKKGVITPDDVERTKQAIEKDILTFESLME